MSFNKVILIGNVGKDTEVRHLETGAAVASFTLATTERYKNRNGELQDQTEWHNIVVWRQTADICEKYVKKGDQLFVEGRIKSRTWETDRGEKRYATDMMHLRHSLRHPDVSTARICLALTVVPLMFRFLILFLLSKRVISRALMIKFPKQVHFLQSAEEFVLRKVSVRVSV